MDILIIKIMVMAIKIIESNGNDICFSFVVEVFFKKEPYLLFTVFIINFLHIFGNNIKKCNLNDQ